MKETNGWRTVAIVAMAFCAFFVCCVIANVDGQRTIHAHVQQQPPTIQPIPVYLPTDRKSTRLNSSH